MSHALAGLSGACAVAFFTSPYPNRQRIAAILSAASALGAMIAAGHNF